MPSDDAANHRPAAGTVVALNCVASGLGVHIDFPKRLHQMTPSLGLPGCWGAIFARLRRLLYDYGRLLRPQVPSIADCDCCDGDCARFPSDPMAITSRALLPLKEDTPKVLILLLSSRCTISNNPRHPSSKKRATVAFTDVWRHCAAVGCAVNHANAV
ncbi:hypothetical protein PG990_001364 [Apiospora arundinis]